MRREITILSWILFFVISSCGKGELLPVEYVNWINNSANGITSFKIISEIEYSVKFTPVEYLAIREIEDLNHFKKDSFDSIKKKYIGLKYFTVKYKLIQSKADILKFGITDPNQYFERMNYFSFELENQIHLVEGDKKFNCVLFNFPRSYGLSPDIEFVIAFDDGDSGLIYDNDLTLIIDDEVYNAGKMQFVISKNALNNLPKLKLT